MADTNKTISIQYKAEVQNLVQGLTKVGNVSEKEAQKMMRSLEKAYDKAARESQKSIAKQEKELKKLRRQAQRTSKSMDMSTKSMAIGFAAAGVAVLGFQQHIADLSNQLVDASTKTGVAVDTLAGLRLAAEGSGLSFENLEAGLIKLPALMQDAAEGGKRASKAFDDLGVSVTETDGEFEKLRSADDVLKDIFKSLQAVEGAEERAAKAAEIFGQRAGPAFIQSGAIDNLESFMALANEFGVSTGPEMRDAMADFQRVSAAAMETVTGEMQRLLDTMTGASEGGGMSAAIMLATESFLFLSTVVQDVFEGIRATISFSGAMVAAGLGALSGNGAEAFKALKDEADRAALSTDKMFDTFARGTIRVNRFRTEVAKTLGSSAGAGDGAGDGDGDGDGETPEQKEQKIAQQALKATQEIKRFSIQLEKDIKRATLDRLKGDEKIDEQTRQRIDAIKGEIAKNDELTTALMNKKNALGEFIMTEKEADELLEKTIAREKQLTQEMVDVRLAGIRAKADAQKEADEEQEKRDKEKSERKAKEFKKDMERIAAQTQMFATVTQEFTQLGELGVQLFERFGEKNKKNAEIAFNVRKGIAISEVAINTATAVTRALAELGPVAGGVATAGIIATGAAQAALIASEEPKFHMGGLVGGSSLAPDERRITAKTGEAVLSTQAVQRLGGESGLNALENGAGMNPTIVVTNPYKHYDRFIKGRKLMGLDSNRTGRGGY